MKNFKKCGWNTNIRFAERFSEFGKKLKRILGAEAAENSSFDDEDTKLGLEAADLISQLGITLCVREHQMIRIEQKLDEITKLLNKDVESAKEAMQ